MKRTMSPSTYKKSGFNKLNVLAASSNSIKGKKALTRRVVESTDPQNSNSRNAYQMFSP